MDPCCENVRWIWDVACAERKTNLLCFYHILKGIVNITCHLFERNQLYGDLWESVAEALHFISSFPSNSLDKAAFGITRLTVLIAK